MAQQVARNNSGGGKARVLFATSEIFPLAKTGGLADVSAALPEALARLGIDVRLIMPGYESALDRAEDMGPALPLGEVPGLGTVELVPARLPGSTLPVWLVDAPAFYRRPGGPYGDPEGRDWPDNWQRFGLFCHAVARLATHHWPADIVHANDWHAGLVPALLARQVEPRPATILTIHNMAFQGPIPPERREVLGLNSGGWTSFLAEGLLHADRLTTVSPRYAREILTPEFGCGLDALLREREGDLVGILNGVDYDGWTPENPQDVPFPYNAADLSGKRACKDALQRECGLEVDPERTLIAFLSRLTHQKMADVLPQLAPVLLAEGAQLVVCGEGERETEQALIEFARTHRRHVSVHIGYREDLARRILAGADALAAPSRFEPCGLTQMYAMRFGTLPIVRRIGGLADTVAGTADDLASTHCVPAGFLFNQPTVEAFADAIVQACRLHREPVGWRRMQLNAMRRDLSWARSAARYAELYAALAGPTVPAVDLDEAPARVLAAG